MRLTLPPRFGGSLYILAAFFITVYPPQLFQWLAAQLACPHLSWFFLQLPLSLYTILSYMPRCSSAAYAEAYSYFYLQMLSAGFQVFGGDSEQGIPVEVSFVPMMHPTKEGAVFIAEKATFGSLMGFLQTEFYRGLALGNAPRRCHNCGQYFLLTAGYNTCYCNNIAPGETERTSRKVGAHRKEAQGKENRTPAQKESDRTYNRLKGRKQRGKISRDEWNTAVARRRNWQPSLDEVNWQTRS